MRRPLVWLFLLHLVGNAVLLGLGYSWLGIGESTNANLALSVGLLLVLLSGTVWLHGSSLAYFRDPQPGTRVALMASLRRLLPLFAVGLLAVAVYFALEVWQPLNESRATDVASYFTLKLQKPIRPATVQGVFDVLWWVIRWMLLPALLLPLASGVAAAGWSGFREWRWKGWSFWLLTPALLVCAVWVPLQLIVWKPWMGSFGQEAASVVARFGAAYLLFVVACLLLAFVTSRGRSSLSQPSTVVSP
ncbi:MAG: hypothetical protein ABIR70_06735 [Bryobacteraceae bacterium]